MTRLRRVVTGHNERGRSIFASDETLESFEIPAMPGFEILNLWGADETHVYPDGGDKPDYTAFFAPVGGYRFLLFTVAPDNVDEKRPAGGDPAADMERLMPGALETFDPDVPGMHRSATVDLLYVVEGACELELDDGARVALNAGDTLVQSGTMHAWRNPHDEPCKIVAVIVGAELDGGKKTRPDLAFGQPL